MTTNNYYNLSARHFWYNYFNTTNTKSDVKVKFSKKWGFRIQAGFTFFGRTFDNKFSNIDFSNYVIWSTLKYIYVLGLFLAFRVSVDYVGIKLGHFHSSDSLLIHCYFIFILMSVSSFFFVLMLIFLGGKQTIFFVWNNFINWSQSHFWRCSW